MKMPLSLVVMGFRHAHIYDLVAHAEAHPDLKLVAMCEEDESTREQVRARGICNRVFASYQEMLDSVDCDIIGVGEYYGRRGAVLIEGLRRGKHVLSDKPVCTFLDELSEIETLSTLSRRSVGCQLDIRDSGNFRRLHEIVRNGEIGEVHAISFDGQHPLLRGTRPEWYFEPGKHGGTLNDIAIHAFDLIPWLTGCEFHSIECARSWNAGLPDVPHFHNAAQAMLTLTNGCGVLGDVSYFSPDSHAYTLPFYWRTTLWGSRGVAKTDFNAPGVALYQNGAAGRIVTALPSLAGGYLRHFLAEIRGEHLDDHLTTREVLRAARVALEAQHAADNNLHDVLLGEKEREARRCL